MSDAVFRIASVAFLFGSIFGLVVTMIFVWLALRHSSADCECRTHPNKLVLHPKDFTTR